MSRPSQPRGGARPPNSQPSSAFTSPTSPGSGVPPSFKTNVNRQKTKKWVEAKPYSYDGDDWGEVDDFDEYGAEQEQLPPPLPPSKTTGLRQKGQAVNPPPTDFSPAQPPGPAEVRKGYGELETQPARAMPDASQPNRGRSNSFEVDDERRAFSTADARAAQQQPAAINDTRAVSVANSNADPRLPATRFSQMGVAPGAHGRQPSSNAPGHAPPDLRIQTQGPFQNAPIQLQPTSASSASAPRGGQATSQPPDATSGNRTLSMDRSSSSTDYQHRADFSPSAIPPPLHAHRQSPAGPPVGRSPETLESGSHFPPRKSSLSQQTSPYIPLANPSASEDTTHNSNQEGNHRSLSQSRDRSESLSKALPFIRPADIYRRVEEERERERLSIDSGRPSMDSVLGTRPHEGDLYSGSNERESSENLTRPTRRRSSLEGGTESDTARRLNPRLDPVTERKSEYGLDNYSYEDAAAQGGGISGQGSATAATELNFEDNSRENRAESASESGFGRSSADGLKQAPAPADGGSRLPHQPSLGFRSAVHQAFDTNDDQSELLTPSTGVGGHSGPDRSNSGSTAGISPILGRNGSVNGSTDPNTGQEPRIISAITEETPEDFNDGSRSRPTSGPQSSHVHGLNSDGSNSLENSSAFPSAFKPGHRRDLSTPSPQNSPAKTPLLESSKEVQSSHTGQLTDSTLTPTADNDMTRDRSIRESDLASSAKSSNEADVVGAAAAEKIAQRTFRPSSDEVPSSSLNDRNSDLRAASPISRAESPTKGSVRNLADRFDTGRSRSGSSHSLLRNESPVDSSAIPSSEDGPQSRVQGEPSFRPALPGGWVSYATTIGENKTPMSTPRPEESSIDARNPTELAPNEEQSTSDEDLKPTPTIATRNVPEPSPSLGGQTLRSDQGPSSQSIERHLDTGMAQQTSLPLPNTSSSHQFGSVQSSAPPTPPPKDTPDPGDSTKPTSQYFSPPPVPLKHKDSRSPAVSYPPPTVQPVAFPTMSTEESPQDQESDRLRKEIVKSLSPTTPTFDSAGRAQAGFGSELDRSISEDSRTTGPSRESTLLPHEYESYWASAQPNQTFNGTQERSGLLGEESDTSSKYAQDKETKQEVDPSTIGQGSKSMFDSRPALLQQRFSWEQGSEQSGSQQTPRIAAQVSSPVDLEDKSGQVRPVPSSQARPNSEVSPDPELRRLMNAQEAYLGDRAETVSPIHGLSPGGQTVPSGAVSDVSQIENTPLKGKSEDDSEPRSSGSVPAEFSNEKMLNEDSARDGLMLADDERAPVSDPEYRDGSPTENARLSGAHETVGDPLSAGNEGPGGAGTTPADPFTITTQQANESEDPASGSGQAQRRLPAFREIMSIKSPTERVEAFNLSRDQLAIMDSGLTQWIAITTSNLPEHLNLLSASGRSVLAAGVVPGVGKETSPTATGIPGQNTQQPYYQQYLNFSNTQIPSQPSPNVPSKLLSSPTPQGFSPSSGSSRKTSQQVQARSKELLHNAGMFGGKANVAAKGLFAKGKSRLRGGADKE
ncbi:MAG: hypothetical protein M4579_006847 [Chaenotheca gracillima]|nr:MAG: hypothetical protein M4579_006847 [Chaenotheca gracillima]